MRRRFRRLLGLSALILLAFGGAAAAWSGPTLQVSTSAAPVSSGDTVSLPDTAPGSLSAPLTITILNVGDQDLRFLGARPVAVSGLGAKMFEIVPQPRGPIAPGSFASFGIVFAPTAAGTHDATVTILSNDPNAPGFTFYVSGDGM